MTTLDFVFNSKIDMKYIKDDNKTSFEHLARHYLVKEESSDHFLYYSRLSVSAVPYALDLDDLQDVYGDTRSFANIKFFSVFKHTEDSAVITMGLNGVDIKLGDKDCIMLSNNGGVLDQLLGGIREIDFEATADTSCEIIILGA